MLSNGEAHKAQTCMAVYGTGRNKDRTQFKRQSDKELGFTTQAQRGFGIKSVVR